jgi:energy-coupling factor transport system permease protein
MTRTIALRHLERSSFVHGVRSDVKIVSLLACTSAIAFNPGWAPIGAGWVLATVVFLAGRLPVQVLAPPPRILLTILAFSGLFSLLSGGDPAVAGIQLGGLLELAQLVALGFLLIAFAALLAWTTSLTEIGLGLGRLLRPLRLVRFPHAELTTVIVLAVRAIPAVRAELTVTMDAHRSRPTAPDQRSGVRAGIGEIVGLGTTVVVGTHRRARDMARAMEARNSVTAPASNPPRLRLADGVVLASAALWTAAIYVWL